MRRSSFMLAAAAFVLAGLASVLTLYIFFLTGSPDFEGGSPPDHFVWNPWGLLFLALALCGFVGMALLAWQVRLAVVLFTLSGLTWFVWVLVWEVARAYGPLEYLALNSATWLFAGAALLAWLRGRRARSIQASSR